MTWAIIGLALSGIIAILIGLWLLLDPLLNWLNRLLQRHRGCRR
jgi:hypothetical protein